MSFDYQKILENVVFSRIFWSDVTCFSRTETLERATTTGNPQSSRTRFGEPRHPFRTFSAGCALGHRIKANRTK